MSKYAASVKLRECVASFLLVGLAAPLSGMAAAGEPMSPGVVLEDTVTMLEDGSLGPLLRKAEVVRVGRTRDGKSWVQRIENPPDWETSSEEDIQRAMRPSLVPSSSLAMLRQFRRVQEWNTSRRARYTACDGSCDFGVTYYFRKDGTFHAVSGANGTESTSSGQLYVYRDVFWARSNSRADASRYTVFFVRGDRQICDYVACMEGR